MCHPQNTLGPKVQQFITLLIKKKNWIHWPSSFQWGKNIKTGGTADCFPNQSMLSLDFWLSWQINSKLEYWLVCASVDVYIISTERQNPNEIALKRNLWYQS